MLSTKPSHQYLVATTSTATGVNPSSCSLAASVAVASAAALSYEGRGTSSLRCAAATLPAAACAYWAGDMARTVSLTKEILHSSPGNPEPLYWSLKAHERLATSALSHFEDLAPHAPATYEWWAISIVISGSRIMPQASMRKPLPLIHAIPKRCLERRQCNCL